MRSFPLPAHIEDMKIVVDDLRQQQEDALGKLQPKPRYNFKKPLKSGNIFKNTMQHSKMKIKIVRGNRTNKLYPTNRINEKNDENIVQVE